MKRRRAIVAGLAAVACAAAALAPAAGAEPRPAPRCNGAKQLCKRPFDRVVLAGAHNAMSAFDLGWKLPNQTLSIPAQLRTGIRALLIDTHYGRLQADGTVITDDDGEETVGERGLYLCHALCELGASPLGEVLDSIARFLRRHPSNALTIINEDHVAAADFAAAVEASRLAEHLYRGAPGPWPRLREMIAARRQVVVLAENDDGGVPWYHVAYEGILQETPYSFKTPDLLTDPANWAASCQPNRGGTEGSLFLLNHWSPSVPPPEPDPAASAAVNATGVILGRARECRRLRGRLPTIIAADQVSYGGLLAAVAKLNRPRRR